MSLTSLRQGIASTAWGALDVGKDRPRGGIPCCWCLSGSEGQAHEHGVRMAMA